MARMRMTVGLGLVVVGAALLVALAGCGKSGHGRASGPFAWLKPASPPGGWKVVLTPGGAALAYPPRWKAIKTDPGTASVALIGGGGLIDGYLNATPRQGPETLADWRRFRPQHNKREGYRDVRLIAATADRHFRSGRGACVIDTYTTSKAAYREIACLVLRAGSSTVVVAAAPTALWERDAATLERAVSSFVA